jgi:hypothetical protein
MEPEKDMVGVMEGVDDSEDVLEGVGEVEGVPGAVKEGVGVWHGVGETLGVPLPLPVEEGETLGVKVADRVSHPHNASKMNSGTRRRIILSRA